MLDPLLVVFTARLPVVDVQFTVKAAVAVPPDGTLTVCGFAPVTVQFVARPESATLWLPALTPLTVTVPFTEIGWPAPPSPVTLYPSGSALGPVVVVVAVRFPTGLPAALSARVVTSHVSEEL